MQSRATGLRLVDVAMSRWRHRRRAQTGSAVPRHKLALANSTARLQRTADAAGACSFGAVTFGTGDAGSVLGSGSGGAGGLSLSQDTVTDAIARIDTTRANCFTSFPFVESRHRRPPESCSSFTSNRLTASIWTSRRAGGCAMSSQGRIVAVLARGMPVRQRFEQDRAAASVPAAAVESCCWAACPWADLDVGRVQVAGKNIDRQVSIGDHAPARSSPAVLPVTTSAPMRCARITRFARAQARRSAPVPQCDGPRYPLRRVPCHRCAHPLYPRALERHARCRYHRIRRIVRSGSSRSPAEASSAQRPAEPSARPEPLGAGAQVLGRSAARGLASRDRRQAAVRRIASGGRACGRRGPVPDQRVQDASCTEFARQWPLAGGRRRDGGMRRAGLLPVGPHRPAYLRGWRLVRRRA